MAKRKKPRRGPAPRKKPDALMTAAAALERIAAREGTTPDMVRKHIQVGLINGLISEDPQIRAAWAQIPHAGEIPTVDEVIAYYATQLSGKNGRTAG